MTKRPDANKNEPLDFVNKLTDLQTEMSWKIQLKLSDNAIESNDRIFPF